MPLLTISDLQNQTQENKALYLQHMLNVGRMWDRWKLESDGNFEVVAVFRGERGRAAGIHASEISGCLRKLVYASQGTPRKVDPGSKDLNMQRRFDVGTSIHALIQTEMHLMCKQTQGYLTFEDEAKIHPGLGGLAEKWNTHSSTDGIFTFWHANQPFLRMGFEIKTMSQGEFEKLREPKEAHKDQTCFYMKMLDVPYMWTLYYNKSTSHYSDSEPPYLYQFDERLWENKLAPRIEKAVELAARNELPAKEEGLPCRWCPFGHTCNPTYLKKQGMYSHVPPKLNRGSVC